MRLILNLACALSLVGCQTATQTAPERVASAAKQERAVHPGDAVVSVVGTPFYLIFKGVVCVASVAIAAPVAAVAALSESHYAPIARRELGDGVGKNCGFPYVLSPSRIAATERALEYQPTAKPEQPPAAGLEQTAPTPRGPTPLFPR